jgi:hypothetical protein
VEAGAKTVLLEKFDVPPGGANWIGAVNSKLTKEAGVKLNRTEIITDLMWHSNYHADQRLINLWYDYSGEMMDWYMDRFTKTGTMTCVLEKDLKDTGKMHISPMVAHVPVEGQYKEMGPNKSSIMTAHNIIRNEAINKGLDYRTGTTAVQLVTDGEKNVTGVIAKDKNGKYIKFNTKKGVILCTGGYINNPDMRKDLNPYQEACGFPKGEAAPGSTGDGLAMGTWIGADMAELHWWMDGDRGLGTRDKNIRFFCGSQPFLRTDCFGNRFCNEDVPYDFGSYAGAMNPDHYWWMIMDANYYEQMTQFATTICSRIVPKKGAANTQKVPQNKEELIKTILKPALATGFACEAATPDELITKMKAIDSRINGDTFKATIDRYNKLCDQGEDLDFGKLPLRMMPLRQAPYYAFWITGSTIATLDGLRVNTNLQVIRPNGSIVKGLYAAGNDQGGFYGMSYPWYYGGLNCGRGMTFARLAAKHACGVERKTTYQG